MTRSDGAGLFQRLQRAVRRRGGTLSRRTAIRKYLASHPVRKLQIGAGHNLLPGWLNTDRDPIPGAIYLDAAGTFPFADGTFDYVFSEHLIEHLPYKRGVAMIGECRRILKPGGQVRLATPNLEVILSLVAAAPGSIGEGYARWLAESYFPDAPGRPATYAINQVFRGWGHKFLYDRETLRAVLEQAGFAGVVQRPFGQSDDEALAGLEGHGVEDGNRRFSEFETLILEAARV